MSAGDEWFYRVMGISCAATSSLWPGMTDVDRAGGGVMSVVLICTAAVLRAVREGRSERRGGHQPRGPVTSPGQPPHAGTGGRR
jgi:hypothetical protein